MLSLCEDKAAKNERGALAHGRRKMTAFWFALSASESGWELGPTRSITSISS
jgi:hypothetical protein